jgi:hypothetical protein
MLHEGNVEKNNNCHGRSVAEIPVEVETRYVQSFSGNRSNESSTGIGKNSESDSLV